MIRLRRGITAVIAAVIAGAAAFGMSTGVFAARANAAGSLGVYLNEVLPQRLNAGNADISAVIYEYVRRTLPYCLSANGLYGAYDFFAPIRLQNWDDDGEVFEKYWVVVSRNGTMTGYLMVSHVEDRLISGFCPKTIPEIGEALSSGAEIQLGYRDGCLLLSDAEDFTVIEGPDAAELPSIGQITVDREASEVIEQIGTVTSEQRGNRKEWSVSDIRAVSNAKSERQRLLCWASCVACMGTQNRPQADHSARSVYLLCTAWELYANVAQKPICDCERSFNEPHGCDLWTQRALALVGVPAKKDKALTAERVSALLAENKPIMIGVYKTRSTRSVGHTVVLCRYEEIDESSGLYVFMDPGMGASNSGLITTVIDRSVMDDGENLILPSVTGTYAYWHRSFYLSDEDGE